MKASYIFVNEKMEIVAKKDNFVSNKPGIEALGYAQGLEKKRKEKLTAYVKVGHEQYAGRRMEASGKV